MPAANFHPAPYEEPLDPFMFARRLRTPIWVYDTERRCIAFANQPACKIWKAEDEASLQLRDLSNGMTASVASRLQTYQSDINRTGAEFDEIWTLHPDGHPPVTIDIILSGFPMPDGRMAMLCEVVGNAEHTNETLRSTKALMHTDVIIALFSMDGTALYKNTAAMGFLPGGDMKLADVFEDAVAFRKLEAISQQGGDSRQVTQIRSVNGVRWLDLTVKQCLDSVTGEQALLVTAFDVSELKVVRAESELRQKQLEATFAVSLDSIVIIDGDGVIVEFNQSSERIFGHKKDDILGKNITMIIPERYREAHRIGLAHMRYSGDSRMFGTRVEIIALRANGEEFVAELAISQSSSTNDNMFIAYIRDISVEKANEQALLDAKDAAEAANVAKSEFLANMSHEIRTPMNGVLGMLDVLRGTDLDEKQAYCTDIIHKSGHNLLAILSDILDFSKIEAGKLSLSPTFCNLEESLGNIAKLFEAQANEKNLALSFTFDADLPNQFIADANRIGQIVSNLVGNAVKFTHEGAIAIGVSGTTDGDYANIKIDVEDTGIGISEDKIDHIFEKFTQAESSTTRQYGGTGLGLAISRRLADAMDGELSVRSDFGLGTAFTLRVRLKKADAVTVIDAPRVPELPQVTPMVVDHDSAADGDVPLHFLMVENAEVNWKVVAACFKHPRIKITFAENGRRAVQACKGTKFDLIFMGASMLGMDSLGALIDIRESEKHMMRQRAPVICLMGRDSAEERDRFLLAGVDDCLTAPLQKDRLYKVASKWLKASRADLYAANLAG